jgi:hypothetical protein
MGQPSNRTAHQLCRPLIKMDAPVVNPQTIHESDHGMDDT